MHYNRPCAYFYIIPYCNWAKHFCSCANDNVISERRVPLAFVLACPAEGNSLVQKHIVAYFGCFAYDRTHSMVYKKPVADFGSWMYFNACQKPGKSRYHPGYKRYVYAVQQMRYSVKYYRVQPGIHENNFYDIPRSGITVKN